MISFPRLAVLCFLLAVAPTGLQASPESDLAGARTVFQDNLNAISNQDRAAYLACYWQDEALTRNGAGGPSQGYAEWAAAMGDDWPSLFEGTDLRLVWLRPGVVYGSYRYRVRFGTTEQAGISERVFLETEEGWRIAVTTAFASPEGTPPPPVALVGGTLVDGNGGVPVVDAVVLIRGGRIECAGSRGDCEVPDEVTVVDVSGMWITPGMIDVKVHLSQTGFADGRPDVLDLRDHLPYEVAMGNLRDHPEVYFNAYLGSGVTSIFDNGGYAWTLDLARRTENNTRAPRMLATGPPLSTRRLGLPNLPGEEQFLVVERPQDVAPLVQYLATRGSGAVTLSIIHGGIPLDTLDAIAGAAGQASTEAGLPFVIDASLLQGAKAALRSGASLLMKLRDPVDEELMDLARKANAVYCPELTADDGWLRLASAAARGVEPTIDDPHGVVDSATVAHHRLLPEYVDTARNVLTLEQIKPMLPGPSPTAVENLKRIHEAGIPVAVGTGAGNSLTLHGPSMFAEMEAMQAAGLSAHEVLVAATRGGAQAMGRAHELGTVEAGKLADLVLFGADPTKDIRHLREIRFVMRGGELRAIEEFKAP